MRKTPRSVLISCIGLVVVAGVAASVASWTRPRYPNPALMSVEQAIGYVGTDAFNQLSRNERREYSLAVAERLRDRSFPQLVSMIAARNGEYKSVSANVKQSGSRDEIEAAVLRVALDKFYEEPPAKRSVYLWSLVRMQQTGGTGKEGIGLPSPQQLQKDMTRVVTRQPPQTVAKMGQFVQDLQEQRKRMGVPNPH